jgi:hypothetical protein
MARRIKIMLQGLEYLTPEVPKYVRGRDLMKRDQVWSRDTTYLQWDWNTDPAQGFVWHEKPSKGQIEWYESEIERLHTGAWIMIYGEAVYFNKYAYFFHQWFMLQEGIYPIFKDTSLEYFRFYQLCEEDDFTLGDCGIKGRRVGLSSMKASINLLIGLLEENTLQGIVSKTGTDAKEMYLMVKNGLENLPEFLMPDLAKVAETELHIAKPRSRISTNNKTVSGDKGKNNRINWLSTAENAYDGRRARNITIDEAAKWEEANVEICLAKISETLVIGASVIGHVSVFSSVNRGDKGGNNFKNIWIGSNHLGKLDTVGQTETRLKRFFLEGYRGYFGYIDKYGNSVIENPTAEQTAYLSKLVDPTTGKKACPNPKIGAKQYIQERRSLLSNNPDKLSEWVRMYPFEWQEVFKDSNNMCHFDLNELNDQIMEIELELEGKNKSENGRVGVFKKADNGEIYFVDNPKGMWYILEFPEQHNKSVYNGSVKCPNNTNYGASGLDTFANAKQTVEKGSDACCIIHKRYDSLNPEASNMPIAMFLGRPKTKEEFHNQIFYGLEYYGIKMLAERSPTDWEDYAIEKRYASPLEATKKHGYLISTKRSNNTEVYGIAPQDKEAREQHLTEMVEYSLNNMKKIRFLRLLKDMVNFNINARTDYDACMAWGYALMGLKEHALPVKKVDNSKLKIFHVFNKPAAQKYH